MSGGTEAQHRNFTTPPDAPGRALRRGAGELLGVRVRGWWVTEAVSVSGLPLVALAGLAGLGMGGERSQVRSWGGVAATRLH